MNEDAPHFLFTLMGLGKGSGGKGVETEGRAMSVNRTHPCGFLLSVGIFVPGQSFKTVGGRECDFFLL